MTTTLESAPVMDAAVPASGSHRLRNRFLLAFVLGLVAVLAIGVGALYAYDQKYDGRILPGVRVGQVDLSGLTADEAALRLRAAYDDLSSGGAVLVAGDKQIALPYSRARRAAAIDSMVAQAMSVGRAGNPVERAIANLRTAFRGVDVAPHDAAIERQVLHFLGLPFDLDGFAAWAQGRPPLDRLVTHRLPLEQAGRGFELMQSGEALRVVLGP